MRMPLFTPLDATAWGLVAFAAFCIGTSKAGFSGISIISVFILAEVLGAKESIGFALPLLIIADLLVYPTYRKYSSWKTVMPLIWPALIGIIIGITVLDQADNRTMRKIIGIVILTMAFIQLLSKINPDKFYAIACTKRTGFTAAILGGIATTLANAAGPIMRIFMVSRRMDKMELLGVSARFFLVINLIKLPLNSGLDLINSQTLLTNLALSPFVALGVFGGYHLVKITPQRIFQITVITFSIIAGIGLCFY
ncbi:MAG: sulfite exporter TauE/SafE family protein [Akkermansiaceae bacterium]